MIQRGDITAILSLRFVLPVAQEMKKNQHDFKAGTVHQKNRTISYVTDNGQGI